MKQAALKKIANRRADCIFPAIDPCRGIARCLWDMNEKPVGSSQIGKVDGVAETLDLVDECLVLDASGRKNADKEINWGATLTL